ncbi:hypothetical protein [Pseudomonas aeruginosa]|uniref:hypothetical protein n=1 Tax=Pseudomonas aeruginosa TaxID=287 RepID=UPI001E39891B|nr:hypothetical protein [Pseudomonas aeruginosa]UFM90193.1 hypothetical protein LO758_04165 [Pseudomonas aeruginosa]UFM98788.1 hypothetical protein LO759_04165 [Pseudomonas aeruginosa]
MSRQMTARRLTRAEMNHLRRLIGWVRCEVGAEPEKIATAAKEALVHFQCVTEDGKQRLHEHYQKSVAVPKYIRAALKALEKVCLEEPAEVVDGELVARGRHEVPLRLVVARNEEEIGNGKLD